MRYETGDHGTVTGEHHIQRHIRLPLYANHLMPLLHWLPAIRGLVFSIGSHVFDKNIFHIRNKIRESPGDALIVPHQHVGQSRQGKSLHIKCRLAVLPVNFQVRFIPGIGNSQCHVHIIREERLSRNRVRARNDPVIRTGDQGIVRREWDGSDLQSAELVPPVCNPISMEES